MLNFPTLVIFVIIRGGAISKNMIKKMIATAVAFALVAVCANAQEVKSFIVGNNDKEVEIFQNLKPIEVMNLLKAGADTVTVLVGQPVENENGITYPVRQYWLADGKGVSIDRNIITGTRRDESLRQKLAQQELDTRMVESLYDDKKRDTYFYHVSGQSGVKQGDPDAGKIVAKSCNKYGWAFGAFGGYEVFTNVNSPVFGVAAQYSQPWWMVEVAAEGGWTKYSYNATHAGEKYFNYRTSAIGGFTVPYIFDKYDINRLYFVGGVKYKWFSTDTKYVEGENYLSSEGNLLSPVIGLRYERRLFATGNNFYVQVTAEQDRAIIQNEADDTSWGVVAKVGFNFGAGRNKVNNTK
jgi:hypothetical protein